MYKLCCLRGFYRDAYTGFTGVLRLSSKPPIFMTELFYDLAVDRTIGNYYRRINAIAGGQKIEQPIYSLPVSH